MALEIWKSALSWSTSVSRSDGLGRPSLLWSCPANVTVLIGCRVYRSEVDAEADDLMSGWR